MMVFIVSGCGLLPSSKSDGPEGAVAANQSYAEMMFDEYTGSGTSYYDFPQQTKGGVWIYTKDKHPVALNDLGTDYSWDHRDMIMVQINDPQLKGKEYEVKRLELREENYVNIVVEEKDYSSSDDKPPRFFILVEKNRVKEGETKFTVSTLDGKTIKLNP
jgi:hypothetical protein